MKNSYEEFSVVELTTVLVCVFQIRIMLYSTGLLFSFVFMHRPYPS